MIGITPGAASVGPFVVRLSKNSDEGCGRLCETAFCAVLQVAVGAFCASTPTSASTPVAGGSGSALGIAQGGTVDPDGVALMAQPTEEGLDERFVAEKRLPFRVVEV